MARNGGSYKAALSGAPGMQIVPRFRYGMDTHNSSATELEFVRRGLTEDFLDRGIVNPFACADEEQLVRGSFRNHAKILMRVLEGDVIDKGWMTIIVGYSAAGSIVAILVHYDGLEFQCQRCGNHQHDTLVEQ
ncbi:hypothetical protein AXG93_1660s1060 [Marchantia polymorpha subsp. ruderalis]|uniref:Uncharacterized protein n=1 Tax=Marchantia polymorpha subsp. ruderalis TaxID=1480154 RepID=A0A176VR24_MARPO|nr:hypothetical protein AXG93_1660s1060 [Marchantia polymorpha subsp. ruderalis]